MRFAASLGILAALSGCTAAAEGAAEIDKTAAWRKLALKAPSHGRYLRRLVGGEPVLWQADTAWELFYRLNRSDVEEYFQDRSGKGFNVVLAAVISQYDGTTRPNVNGDLPLVDGDPTRPNDKYFDHVDYVLQRAASYGILVAMAPTWGSHVAGPSPIFDEAKAESYGRYLGARYAGLPKILGGDSNAFTARNLADVKASLQNPNQKPVTLGPVEDMRSIWAAMVRGFQQTEAADGYAPFITWYASSGWLPNTPLPYGHNYLNGMDGTLSIDAVHSGDSIPGASKTPSPEEVWDSTMNYANVQAMLSSFPGPVVDLGNRFENGRAGPDSDRIFNSSDVRHSQYNSLFSGAAGVTYGTAAVAQMYAPVEKLMRPDLYVAPDGLTNNESWHEALQYGGSVSASYASQLFHGMNADEWDTMAPERSFILTPDDKTDVLKYEKDRYVAGLVSSAHCWVYTGWGDALDLDLDGLALRFAKPRLAGPTRPAASVAWYDPRKGVFLRDKETGTFALVGRKSFTPPTGGTAEDDWVLVLTQQ